MLMATRTAHQNPSRQCTTTTAALTPTKSSCILRNELLPGAVQQVQMESFYRVLSATTSYCRVCSCSKQTNTLLSSCFFLLHTTVLSPLTPSGWMVHLLQGQRRRRLPMVYEHTSIWNMVVYDVAFGYAAHLYHNCRTNSKLPEIARPHHLCRLSSAVQPVLYGAAY